MYIQKRSTDTDALETVCTVYGEDFDYARLKAQLELFSHEDKDGIQQRTQCRKEQEDEDDSDSREDSEESSQLPPGIVDLCKNCIIELHTVKSTTS